MDRSETPRATGLMMQAQSGQPLSSSMNSEQEAFEPETITPLRILFVDDDDTIREAMVAILAWFGHDTLSAARGGEAMQMYHSNVIDLVITDNQMPDMKGYELAQKIRKMNPEAKIIMLTGWNNEENECNTSFINCTLMKPVTMQTILDTIQNLFPKSS